MASSRPWPFDEDRPSGSVRPLRQADLQAILAHLGDDPDELLAGTDADRPVVAVRVRATVGHPGGSARARWRRLRAAEWAAWMRTLPWRVAAILCIGAAGGLLGSLLAPRLGLVVGGLAALAAGWGLRFRASPDAVAWRRGAAGERRTARLLNPLERHGWAILHDLALPGSRANIDHLAIGPGGVFVIDSKQYRGRLQLDPIGRLWHGRYPLAPALGAVSFEADQGRPGPARPRRGSGADRGRPRGSGPLGQGGHARRAGRGGPAPAKHASPTPGGARARAGRRPGRPGPDPLPRRSLTRPASRAAPYLLVAGVLGLEVLAAEPAGDRPRGVLLSPDPERPGRLAATGHLEPLAGLAGRLLPVAILTALPLSVAWSRPWPPSKPRRRKVSRYSRMAVLR
jgi:hypothetical protein